MGAYEDLERGAVVFESAPVHVRLHGHNAEEYERERSSDLERTDGGEEIRHRMSQATVGRLCVFRRLMMALKLST